MKKHFTLILFIITILSIKTTFAQEQRREEIESFRVAYFTRQVGLNTEEAKKFWPIFNEMQEEIQKLHRERRNRHRAGRDNYENISDVELEKMINEEFVSRQKELDIEKKYHEKFKDVLPMKKLAQFYRAQEGFKRELLKKIQSERRPD
jgi:Skp family chaperone for outer membrane proteins